MTKGDKEKDDKFIQTQSIITLNINTLNTPICIEMQ
jgi:hypothetical protein